MHRQAPDGPGCAERSGGPLPARIFSAICAIVVGRFAGALLAVAASLRPIGGIRAVTAAGSNPVHDSEDQKSTVEKTALRYSPFALRFGSSHFPPALQTRPVSYTHLTLPTIYSV